MTESYSKIPMHSVKDETIIRFFSVSLEGECKLLVSGQNDLIVRLSIILIRDLSYPYENAYRARALKLALEIALTNNEFDMKQVIFERREFDFLYQYLISREWCSHIYVYTYLVF